MSLNVATVNVYVIFSLSAAIFSFFSLSLLLVLCVVDGRTLANRPIPIDGEKCHFRLIQTIVGGCESDGKIFIAPQRLCSASKVSKRKECPRGGLVCCAKRLSARRMIKRNPSACRENCWIDIVGGIFCNSYRDG